MHSGKQSRRRIDGSLVATTAAICFFLVALELVIWHSPFLRDEVEAYLQEASMAFDHSAADAYAYGDEHFNVADPQAYDIAAAQYFYQVAAKRDPTIIYVYHQLSRIAFLNGDFPEALTYIDMQILSHGDTTPPSYYVRGLIEGYMGDYADAAQDYGHFLKFDPEDWAGMNDYAWVLLKDNQPKAAASVTSAGLILYPNNPWLLNSNATALYEIGDIKDARTRIQQASQAVQGVTTSDWSFAYPGNDPDIAAEGLATFKAAILNNLDTIDSATSSGDALE